MFIYFLPSQTKMMFNQVEFHLKRLVGKRPFDYGKIFKKPQMVSGLLSRGKFFQSYTFVLRCFGLGRMKDWSRKYSKTLILNAPYFQGEFATIIWLLLYLLIKDSLWSSRVNHFFKVTFNKASIVYYFYFTVYYTHYLGLKPKKFHLSPSLLL